VVINRSSEMIRFDVPNRTRGGGPHFPDISAPDPAMNVARNRPVVRHTTGAALTRKAAAEEANMLENEDGHDIGSKSMWLSMGSGNIQLRFVKSLAWILSFDGMHPSSSHY
jgi:hypothetical protein